MFEPIRFVYYLKYMGMGMLGVFIIIGIIIAVTYAIGSAHFVEKNIPPRI